MKIELNHALKRVEISAFEIEHALTFEYFDKVPVADREATLLKAIHVGVLALEQDRISTFLANTDRELGIELEALKIRFDLSARAYDKSALKGSRAEASIQSYLDELNQRENWGDEIAMTGSAKGALERNKTGDIVCTLGTSQKRIVIESKFDKGLQLGELARKDWFGPSRDTALSQLIEAKANRDACQSIIVFDRSAISPSIGKASDGVTFISPFGFVVVVDQERGHFEYLGVAYALARQLALRDEPVEFASDLLLQLVDRIIADTNELSKSKKLVESIIGNARSLLEHVEKSRLSLEHSKSHLVKLVEERSLGDADLLNYYTGGDLKSQLKAPALASPDPASAE